MCGHNQGVGCTAITWEWGGGGVTLTSKWGGWCSSNQGIKVGWSGSNQVVERLCGWVGVALTRGGGGVQTFEGAGGQDVHSSGVPLFQTPHIFTKIM